MQGRLPHRVHCNHCSLLCHCLPHFMFRAYAQLAQKAAREEESTYQPLLLGSIFLSSESMHDVLSRLNLLTRCVGIFIVSYEQLRAVIVEL
jgi:hypothetical protein